MSGYSQRRIQITERVRPRRAARDDVTPPLVVPAASNRPQVGGPTEAVDPPTVQDGEASHAIGLTSQSTAFSQVDSPPTYLTKRSFLMDAVTHWLCGVSLASYYLFLAFLRRNVQPLEV